MQRRKEEKTSSTVISEYADYSIKIMHSRSCPGIRSYSFHHKKADKHRLYRRTKTKNRNVLFVAIFTVKIFPSR